METGVCECCEKWENVIIERKENDSLFSFRGDTFYSYSKFTDFDGLFTKSTELALHFAHFRAKQAEDRVEVLEKHIQQLESSMKLIMDAIELHPDGPVAEQIIEQSFKNTKNERVSGSQYFF